MYHQKEKYRLKIDWRPVVGRGNFCSFSNISFTPGLARGQGSLRIVRNCVFACSSSIKTARGYGNSAPGAVSSVGFGGRDILYF